VTSLLGTGKSLAFFTVQSCPTPSKLPPFGARTEGDRVDGLEALLPHSIVVLGLARQHVVALTCTLYR
jgi:hypothetical protein